MRVIHPLQTTELLLPGVAVAVLVSYIIYSTGTTMRGRGEIGADASSALDLQSVEGGVRGHKAHRRGLSQGCMQQASGDSAFITQMVAAWAASLAAH